MLYIHIPFCKQKCSYCNFHFSTSLKMKGEMLEAMKKELYLRQNELPNKKFNSIYLGGGTPSILTIGEIVNFFSEIQKYFSFDKDIEITLEANPDDLTPQFLRELKENTSINRFSIGIQSFFEDDLRLMNRAHTAQEAERCIKLAQDFGFENINIDLIYGVPTSNFEQWQKNLQKAVDLQIQHISSYALTIEPKTALNQWIKKKPELFPKESVQSRDFFYMVDFLQNNDFEHYEISNFGKKGFHSKHNSAYWAYQPYLGIGASAHSYNGKNQRSWNVANNAKYIKSLQQNILPIETELLSLEDCYNEMLMIGLRTAKGVDLEQMYKMFPKTMMEYLQKSISPKIADNILHIENNHLKIYKKHWFLADGIASDLFLI